MFRMLHVIFVSRLSNALQYVFNFDAMLRMPGAVDIRFSKVRYDFALGTGGEGGGRK